MAGTSKKKNWSTHDGACNSCRTRKIRCGREKPQCSCCCRDQVRCIYSSPPKRVNHVKVLCESFDDIQDRVIMMQGELSWLTATLKRSNVAGQLELDSERELPFVDMSPPSDSVDTAAHPVMPGHVVRDGGTQLESYYGPWTLVALCGEFEADLASHVDSGNDEVVGGLINKMLFDTTRTDDENLDLGTRPGQLDNSIRLPPRQLLCVMLDNFLKQVDYSTDIFCRPTIYEALERAYKEPSSPTSEPWALCFNLIILLTLGAEHPIHSEDPFVRPMLQAAHAAARKPSFFMLPRLVNVQTLALLSLLTQQYHINNESLGDSIFAQACILARKLGLHQAGHGLAPSSNFSPVEAEERQKVFGSLYIRDRFSATASGALTCLPHGAPKGPPPTSTSTYAQACFPSDRFHTQYTPHLELAKVQDDLDRLLNSADVPEMSTSKRRIALARLQQKLETWTQTHNVPSSTRPTTVDEISLHLAFLGTRIQLLDRDNNTSDAAQPSLAQVLDDARLSCLLVATACNHHLNQALTDRLDYLLNITFPAGAGTRSSSTTSSPTSASSPSSANFSSVTDAPQRTCPLTPQLSSADIGQAQVMAPLPLHRLASVFPTTAIFVLARHVLGINARAQLSQSAPPTAQNDEQRQQEVNQDISLLEALLSCFYNAPPPAAAAARGNEDSDIHGSKLGRAIQGLVDIIHAIVGPTDNGDGDGDANDVGNNDDMYAAEPLLVSTSSLRLDASSDAISMPNLDLYGSKDISPSHFELPPRSSSTQPTWAPLQDSISSSGTPLFTTQSSLYAPSITSTPSTIPDTPFDISQFLHQMSTSSPVVRNSDQGQAKLQTQRQQEQVQFVSDATKKRSRKRPRRDGSRDQKEHSRYRPGVN